MNRRMISVLAAAGCVALLFHSLVAAGAADTSNAVGAGSFLREHWFERGPGHGNFPVTARFRVNAPDAVLHPSFGQRKETKASGMMQILMEEDLFQLEGVDLYAELWGGHGGTSNKRVTPNGRTTYVFDEVGTAGGACTHQYPVVPLKITDLVDGHNALQFACDRGKSFWGHYIVEEAALRAWLKRGHPDLRAAGLDGFEARVTARAAAGKEALEVALETANPGAIASVVIQGRYDGYDENGDGATLDWHGFTKKRQAVAMVAVLGQPPFRALWDVSMLPDQKFVSLRALVRFKDRPGMVYIGPGADNIALSDRAAATVRRFVSKNLPQHFTSRMNRRVACDIEMDLDPAAIARAQLHVVVWDGGRGEVEDYFTLNGRAIKVAGEGRHDTIYSVADVDPKLLRHGANHIELRSDTEGHGIEVLLPGPALIVRARK